MCAACASSPSLQVNGVQSMRVCVCLCVVNRMFVCECVCLIRVYTCVCVRSTVSFEFPGEQINWQPFAIIDFYHTHTHTTQNTCI